MSDAEEQEDGSTPLSVGARRSGFPHKAIAYANRGATPCDVPPPILPKTKYLIHRRAVAGRVYP